MQHTTFDDTPPEDLPPVIIMLDPKYGFWIRVGNESGGADCPHDGYFATLPGAVQAGDRLGHRATHYVDKAGYMREIPVSIKRGGS